MCCQDFLGNFKKKLMWKSDPLTGSQPVWFSISAGLGKILSPWEHSARAHVPDIGAPGISCPTSLPGTGSSHFQKWNKVLVDIPCPIHRIDGSISAIRNNQVFTPERRTVKHELEQRFDLKPILFIARSILLIWYPTGISEIGQLLLGLLLYGCSCTAALWCPGSTQKHACLLIQIIPPSKRVKDGYLNFILCLNCCLYML